MLQRMLIDRMENRILVGITMFVGTMLLVGWVAINENARMASFERQYHARSIERGAALFANLCSTCHGNDGRGIGLRAPGLNSPHFFGYDFLAGVNARLDALNDEESALNEQRITLATELVDPNTSAERAAEIDAELAEIGDRLSGENSIAVERAALLEERDSIVADLQPAVDNGYPLTVADDGTLDYQPTRLGQVSWGSTLYDFIFTTLVHGRPTSISYWGGNQMVAWSQAAGGTLRDDQLNDLANYILNWDKGSEWTTADAVAVNQYAIVPGAGGGPVELAGPPAGTDVEAIVAEVVTLTGDADRGSQIYSRARSGRGSVLGCSGCHLGGVAAPNTEETWDNIVNIRLTLPQFAGYTAEQYIVESIVNPNAYVVSGYASGAMPADFGTRMTTQDMADIIAYLRSYSESE